MGLHFPEAPDFAPTKLLQQGVGEMGPGLALDSPFAVPGPQQRQPFEDSQTVGGQGDIVSGDLSKDGRRDPLRHRGRLGKPFPHRTCEGLARPVVFTEEYDRPGSPGKLGCAYEASYAPGCA